LLKSFIILLFLSLASPAFAAPQPGEGYVRTPDGVRLFYHVEGHGAKTLVVVHGGPGNAYPSVEPDFAPFARDFTVIYYDQRGNGRSDLVSDPAALALDRHVADLDSVRAHFGLERMNLLGNSWGGLLVAAYAAAHPDRIERLVLDSPAPPTLAGLIEMSRRMEARAARVFSPEQRRHYDRIADPAARLKAADPVALCREWAAMLIPILMERPELAPKMRGDICSGPPEAVRVQQIVNAAIWSQLGDYDFRAAMASVKAPVLVVHGAGDNISTAAARQWADSFPNGKLLEIEGAGHITQVERPDIFFPAIEAFLAGA